jgi:ankyrin repeat protein
MNLVPLQVRAGLEQYEKQGKDLAKAFRSGDPDAMRIVRQHHPRLPGRANTNDRNSVSDSKIRRTGVAAADAQTVVARWHGFESWPKLVNHIDALSQKNSQVLQFELAVEAIIAGDVATLKSLLREYPKLVRARSTREHQATLLHYVGANGVEGYRQRTPKNAVEVAKVLLKAGAEIDADLDYGPRGRRLYPERRGSTTLGMVATSCHPAEAGVQIRLLKILLDAGAAVDGLRGSWNPLVAALHNGRGDAAKYLAKRGARMDLEGAAGVGRLDVVKSFFKKDGGLKPNATKAQMEAGFAWACEYGRTPVVAFLLQKGIDVGAQPHGETGLHWAAYSGQSDVVKLFLKRNAPVDVKDQRFGGTPLGWALYGWCSPPPESRPAGCYEVVKLLVSAGATVDPSWLADPDRDMPLVRKIREDSRMLAALGGEKP